MNALSFAMKMIRTAKVISLIAFSPLLTVLGGCSAFNYSAEDAPQPLAKPAALNSNPRIAIVLGSGGPRGYAHVGAIKILEAAGIEPDLIVGQWDESGGH
jgi:NTE family protein